MASTPCNSHPIRDVPVAKAVIEVLHFLACHGPLHSLEVTVKSGQETVDSQYIWFFLKGPGFGHLLTLLKELQTVEEESHLCLQYPDPASSPVTHTQVNLILDTDGHLSVVHREHKQVKHQHQSSFHLRVLQRMEHMLQESQHLYTHLQVLKVFRPQARMKFTMKIDDSLSQSNFRSKFTIKVGPTVPQMVADTAFCIRGDLYQCESERIRNACSSAPQLVSVLDPDRSITSIVFTAVAAYIPVNISTDQTTCTNSVITLTVLGPCQSPVEVSMLSDNPLEHVSLTEVGLKQAPATELSGQLGTGVLPFHWAVETRAGETTSEWKQFVMQVYLLIDLPSPSNRGITWVQAELMSIFKQVFPQVCQVIQKAVHKVLQPVLAKIKTQATVKRSIRTMTKAIVDIVTMSNKEAFRSSCFDAFKVAGTSELGDVMAARLSRLSMIKHFKHTEASQDLPSFPTNNMVCSLEQGKGEEELDSQSEEDGRWDDQSVGDIEDLDDFTHQTDTVTSTGTLGTQPAGSDRQSVNLESSGSRHTHINRQSVSLDSTVINLANQEPNSTQLPGTCTGPATSFHPAMSTGATSKGTIHRESASCQRVPDVLQLSELVREDSPEDGAGCAVTRDLEGATVPDPRDLTGALQLSPWQAVADWEQDPGDTGTKGLCTTPLAGPGGTEGQLEVSPFQQILDLENGLAASSVLEERVIIEDQRTGKHLDNRLLNDCPVRTDPFQQDSSATLQPVAGDEDVMDDDWDWEPELSSTRKYDLCLTNIAQPQEAASCSHTPLSIANKEETDHWFDDVLVDVQHWLEDI